MRPRFEVSQGAIRMRTSGSPEANGATHPAFSKLYSMPDLEETTPGSGVYDHWTGGSAFSYWWEFLSAWGILPGSANPRTITLRVGGVNFPVEIYEYDEDTTLSGSIGTSTNDNNGVVVICHGKLTLSNVTAAARKRGLFVWGNEVSGSANMTQKGAHVAGQSLYVYPGITVPASGGVGASSSAYKPVGTFSVSVGQVSGTAPPLGCGSGYSGSGTAYMMGSSTDTGGAINLYTGSGGTGTSYCGGAGGGNIVAYNPVSGSTFTATGEAATGVTLGGRACQKDNGYPTQWQTARGGNTGGGLLVVTGKLVSGTFTSTGGTGSGGGKSGGGCVVALANEIGSVSKSVDNGGYLIQEV